MTVRDTLKEYNALAIIYGAVIGEVNVISHSTLKNLYSGPQSGLNRGILKRTVKARVSYTESDGKKTIVLWC